MIVSLRLPCRIFSRNRLLSSVSGANYISDYESTIQSLKTNLHPETLINVLSSTHDLNSSLRLFKWASLQSQFQHTTDTYYHIIMKLGMASRTDEMVGFCNELVKTKSPASEQALLTLLDNFITHRKLDEALRVLSLLNSNSYKQPSIALTNRLLSALVEDKRGIKSVLFVYKEMVKASVGPNTETLNHLIKALFDADHVDSALDQFKRMSKKGCSPDSATYEIVATGLIGKNLLDKALVVLNGDYNVIIKSMCHLFKGNHLLTIVGRMVVQGCPLNSETYNLVIKSMTEDQRSTECALFLNRMVNEGLLPDTEILYSSLSFLAQKFQLHLVLPTVHKLLSGSDHGVLNHAICNVVIRGLWKEGYKDEARLLLDMMLEKGWVPDPTTHQLLISSGSIEVFGEGEVDTQDEIANILCEGFGEL